MNIARSFMLLLALCLPFAQTLADDLRYEWQNVTAKAAFAARDGACALTFRGRMWLIGGWNPGDKQAFPRICNNEVWNLVDGKEWTLVKPNTFLDDTLDATRDWEGRHTAGYAVSRDRLWMIGGDVNQKHYQNALSMVAGNNMTPDVWKLVRK